MNFWEMLAGLNEFEWLCVAFISVVGILGISGLLSRLIIRGTRAFMVAARGWPPPHLDADGDAVESDAGEEGS